MAETDASAPGRPAPLTVIQRQHSELRCPSARIPIGFWNDPEDRKYRAANFEHVPGVWRHDDRCAITGHGGMISYGRSDATPNPGGVHIGTAEIYRLDEQLDEQVESLLIGQNRSPGQPADVRVVLFVTLRSSAAMISCHEPR